MTFRWVATSLLLRRTFAACAAVLLADNALAVVAQEPLLSKTTNVQPNIALILDSSGSMKHNCIFAKQLAMALRRDTGATPNCFPEEALPNFYPAPNVPPFDSIRFLYSPFNNLLYYNPLNTYGPGYLKGERQPDATVGDADIVTIYLPIEAVKNQTNPTLSALQTESNYNSYEVTRDGFRKNNRATIGNPFGKHHGSRTDCAGDRCTHREERINIANWRKSHRTRMLAAKTGVSAAFASQRNNFRLAYANLYAPLNTMTEFGVARPDFFSWLDKLDHIDWTPLRSALDRAGKYYQNSADTGPWGAKPWAASPDTSAHLACRRSYALMITDGYWTNLPDSANQPTISDLPGGLADADGKKDFPQLTHDVTKQTYRYTPGDKVDPRNRGKSDKTDGSPGIQSTNLNDPSSSGTLADVALKYWATDLRPGLPNNVGPGRPNAAPFWQNMTSYMVSFGAFGAMTEEEIASAKAGTRDWDAPKPDHASAIDDARHAAHNGGGDFLTVTDAEQFRKDLGSIISHITSERFSESGVAALGTVLDTNARKFVPSYNSGSWWGNLQKVKPGGPGPDGWKDIVEWQVIKTDTAGQPTGETTLGLPEDRKIFVWVDVGKQAVEFTYANIDLAGNKLKGGNDKLQMSSAVNADLVNFLRGDQTQEGTIFRSRAAVLGDIVNSTPVFIKNNTNPKYEKLPADTPGLNIYKNYLDTKAARKEGVLFVGANDGMLHAFAEGSANTVGGRELFAYVPRSVLGKMESLATSPYTHTYLVDGPLSEVDAYISGAGWRNLVVGTAGAGAKAVFALNVTNPLKMNGKSVLWEINPDPAFPVLPGNGTSSFQELGHVLSPVQSGITRSGHWVSIFGNGYDSKSGQASLFIVETGSGKLLKEIKTNNTPGNGLGGVRLVLNSMQQIIGAYAGDLRGRLWKFDLSGATPDMWALGYGGRAMFTAQNEGRALPITAQPAVVERSDQPNFRPSYLVTVGTGKLFEAGDLASTTPVQAVYGLWDTELFGASGGKAITDDQLEGIKLVPVTDDIAATAGGTLNEGATTFYTLKFINPSVTSIDWTQKRGWKMNLDVFPGQRNISPLQAIGEVVQINPITPPASGDSCQASSTSISIFINPLTGACRGGGTLDTNADGNIDDSDANVCALSAAADGSDVFFTILNSGGEHSGMVLVGNWIGNGPVRIFGGKKPLDCSDATYAAAHSGECSNISGSAAIINRSWRQIFPRAN
jgi:type IV pilus assembly protein PilY1